MSNRRLLIVVGLMLAQWHCGSANSAGGPGPNSCAANTDCTAPTVCDMHANVCVAASASSELVFVGSPANGLPTSNGATTATDPMAVSSGTLVTVALQRLRTLSGTIELANSSPVSAGLTLHREGSTPLEQPIQALSTAPSSAYDTTPAGYSVQLIPGVYDITITPTDLTMAPPWFSTGYMVAALAQGMRNAAISFNVQYNTTQPVTGTLVDSMTLYPAVGVPVSIVDPANNNRLISTQATTADAAGPGAPGSFSLQLSPGATTNWSLQLISAPSAQLADPTEVTGHLVYQIDAAEFAQNTAATGLMLRVPPDALDAIGGVSGSCDGCVTVQAGVEYDAADGTPTTITGATIDLHATDTLTINDPYQRAWYDAQAVTASANATTPQAGWFSASLPRGTYQTIITPPVGDGYAITQTQIEVGTSPMQVGQILQVRPSIPITGTVVAPVQGGTAMPLANASVSAVPLPPTGDLANSVVAPLARPSQTTTRADGSFVLPVDEGDYLIVVQPPDGSGLSTEVFSSEGLEAQWQPSAADSTVPQPVALTQLLTLTVPFMLMGTIVDATSAAVPQGVVHAYSRHDVSSGTPVDVQIATATADGTGTFSMLVGNPVTHAYP